MRPAPLGVLSLALLAATGAIAEGATVYSTNSDFTVSVNSNTDDQIDGDSVPWLGYFGNSTTGKAPAPIDGTYRVGVFNGNSASGGLNDYLFFQKNSGLLDMDFFAHTGTQSSFASFSPSDFSDLSATWLVNSSSVGANGYRLTIEIGGAWWATSAPVATGFNYLSSSWVPVLDTASSLSLGTAVSTSAELFQDDVVITSVGFYVNQQAAGSTTLRIDNFTITGTPVPEPSATLFALLGGSSLLLRRRRA